MSTILYTSIINKCRHSSENSAWESLVSELREPAPANSHPWLITKKKKVPSPHDNFSPSFIPCGWLPHDLHAELKLAWGHILWTQGVGEQLRTELRVQQRWTEGKGVCFQARRLICLFKSRAVFKLSENSPFLSTSWSLLLRRSPQILLSYFSIQDLSNMLLFK